MANHIGAHPADHQGSHGMTTNGNETRPDTLQPGEAAATEPPRQLAAAAQRALKEAAERRVAREVAEAQAKVEAELGGRAGPDPVRYGDWENGGIASDF
jgi:hypothetical protein